MAAPETPAMLCARLREIAEDGDTSDVYGNRVMRAVALIETLTSPAATPVSEAGGEAVARSWRRTKFEFIGAMRQALINSGLTREQVIIADNAITEAFSALAKPASSPAPVRPIGNQGISDYQREIARNMAEGFAAWNAARQEALPSDEPTFSPAGGDVVEALKRIAEHPEKYDDGVQSYDVGFAFWNVQKIARNALAALSQSTSAGRVGE